MGVGDYTGGELWGCDPLGPVTMEVTRAVPGWPDLVPGVVAQGTIHCVRRAWTRFDGTRPHATMPIKGTRYTLIFFTVESCVSAPQAALIQLEGLGFLLPQILRDQVLSAETGVKGERIAHVVLEEETVEQMLELECPTNEYYEALKMDMERRHPDADPFVLEHLGALEELLDVAIVTGFSFGTEKAQLLQASVKVLGEIVGRECREPTQEHVKAILNYPTPIPGVAELRRFFGKHELDQTTRAS